MAAEILGSASGYLSKFTESLRAVDVASIDRTVGLIETAWRSGKQIITLGNGGSSLTALHYINDWNKSIYLATHKKFRGRTLVDNVGLMMAYANDFSFQDLFVEQLKSVLESGDLVIGISGSGNSENVLRAIRYANENGGITLGICGYDGGKLKSLVQHHLWFNVHDMQITEDMHFMFGHIVMQTLCRCKD